MAGEQRARPVSRSPVVASVVALFLALLAGATFPGRAAASGATVIIDKNFLPSPVTVYVGQTVTWKNQDTVSHWVWPDSGGFAKSGEILPGGTFRAVFRDIGKFGYHDALYTFMHGMVIVEAAPKTAAPTRAPTPRPTLRQTPAPVSRTTTTTKSTPKATPRPTAKPTAKPTAAPAAAASAPGASGGPGASSSAGPGLAGSTGSTGSGGGGLDWLPLVIAVLVAGALAFVVGRMYQQRRSLASAGPATASPADAGVAAQTVVFSPPAQPRAPAPEAQAPAPRPAAPRQQQDLTIPAWLRRRQGQPGRARGPLGRGSDPDDLPIGGVAEAEDGPAGWRNDREDDL